MSTIGPGFFEDEDAERERQSRRESPPYIPPPWVQAPDDDLPGRVLLDLVLAQREGAALILREIRARPSGFEVVVDWMFRRLDGEAAGAWHDRIHRMHRLGPDADAGGPRFGLIGSDGTKVPAVGIETLRATVNAATGGAGGTFAEPTPPTAMTRHDGGGGSGRLYRSSGGLWVWWPEFTGGALQLVSEWRDEGFEASATALDGNAIAAARTRARPLWD